MISNNGTAKLVSDTVQRFRAELRQIHPAVEKSCSGEEFHAYSKALSRILHHLDGDILQKI
jgi:hypothetical protein